MVLSIMKEFIAHIVKYSNGSWASPHFLTEHSEETARLAEEFASKFHSESWGKACGMAHDAGKGRLLWQQYLKTKSGYDQDAHLEGRAGKIPHAIHGAELVEHLYGKGIGRILAYCIAGHHTGLPDWSIAEGSGYSSLQFQKTQAKDVDQINSIIKERLAKIKPTNPPWKFNHGLDLSLWIRMLFSCLVDADFLDTERYMNPSKATNRGGYCSISQLLERLNRYCEQLKVQSEKTKVNDIREKIKATCIQRAKEPQGIFSLRVPTGGGKTISSLAFALEHAKHHGLDRIIYVIPYSSIVEQNADVFRAAVGKDQVVEHHSNIEDGNATMKSRLAAENWDAPLIVTTTVQFFESLFASNPSRCRKLHNIVKSVIVLDEAQLMPVKFLAPILETIQLLADHYQVSVVISTATQPAFEKRLVGGTLFKGLNTIKEIMGPEDQINLLYKTLTRNQVEFPSYLNKKSSWEEIATGLVQYNQVLCIVSDRTSCRELHRLMPKETYHLSALMCGQHRSDIITEIKHKLTTSQPVRVISTQLVEAGVDFDFPVVYRAFAGLDSIVQAAGRCNREGKSPQLGKVIVFNPPQMPPAGILRKAAEITKTIVNDNNNILSNYSIFEMFYEKLYWKVNSLDEENICALLDPIQNDREECSIFFRAAATKFKIIDDSEQKTVLVPYRKGKQLIDILKIDGPDRQLLRKLQRFAVSIGKQQFDCLKKAQTITEPYPGIFVLSSGRGYSRQLGLLLGIKDHIAKSKGGFK